MSLTDCVGCGLPTFDAIRGQWCASCVPSITAEERLTIVLDRIETILDEVDMTDWNDDYDVLYCTLNEARPMVTHTVLVAVEVSARTRTSAYRAIHRHLASAPSPIDAWWIAEDDRTDGSDNDSAIFVPMGSQERERDDRLAIDSIASVLYPDGDPDHQWNADTLDAVAEIIRATRAES
jgi:hypothetical protein